MIKAIIFDCFGVIYPDTLALVERPYLTANDDRRQKIRDLRLQCDMGLIDRDAFWNSAAKILSISRVQLDRELDKIGGADWELLEYIKSHKHAYKTAIVSNVGRGFLERIFDNRRPEVDYFDVVIASGDIGVMKPDPRIYKIVADRLNVKPHEAVFIDDKQVHCEGAKHVGMQAILYRDFHQFKRELDKILADSDH